MTLSIKYYVAYRIKVKGLFCHALSDIFNKVNFGGITYEEIEMEQHTYFAADIFLEILFTFFK